MNSAIMQPPTDAFAFEELPLELRCIVYTAYIEIETLVHLITAENHQREPPLYEYWHKHARREPMPLSLVSKAIHEEFERELERQIKADKTPHCQIIILTPSVIRLPCTRPLDHITACTITMAKKPGSCEHEKIQFGEFFDLLMHLPSLRFVRFEIDGNRQTLEYLDTKKVIGPETIRVITMYNSDVSLDACTGSRRRLLLDRLETPEFVGPDSHLRATRTKNAETAEASWGELLPFGEEKLHGGSGTGDVSGETIGHGGEDGNHGGKHSDRGTEADDKAEHVDGGEAEDYDGSEIGVDESEENGGGKAEMVDDED